MVISSTGCSKNVRDELEIMGYEFVEFGSNTGYVDAILYTGHLSRTFESGICGNANGIFVINADGKTAEEIDNILQKRLYSPIFSL